MKLQTIGFLPNALTAAISRATAWVSVKGAVTKFMKMLSTPSSSRSTSMAARNSGPPAVATTSIGFSRAAWGSWVVLSRAIDASESFGTSRPAATRTSVAMTAGPPVFVMIPTRFPAGIGWVANAMAARDISSSSPKERMPVFSKISSVAMSTPASDPVWDEAALAPWTVRPAFIASTGFFAATSRATSRNSFGSENPSV